MQHFNKIGHRGAKAYAPENTLESFQKAIDLGVDMIELDVHLDQNAKIWVLHDETLDRTTNLHGEIMAKSSAELQKGIIDKKFKIPLLSEVFEIARGKCKMNIELKGVGTAKAVSILISEQNFKKEDLLISGFNWNELKIFHAEKKEISIGVLTEDNVEDAINFGKEIKAKAIHPSKELLNAKSFQMIKEHNFDINVWTVNAPNEILKFAKMGVDGIISDYPDRLQQHFLNTIEN